MGQVALGIFAGEVKELLLPSPAERLMDDVVWGEFDVLFTPAFWAMQAWLDSDSRRYSFFKLGASLKEEVAACLLGGHGIPSEVGLAAYRRVKDSGLLSNNTPSLEEIISALKEPLEVAKRQVHYRFWRQKSKYLYECLKTISNGIPPYDDHRTFRNWLAQNLPGVGPKTASWITRNWLSSNEVAIIDIHIQRAGLYAGFFQKNLSVDKNYYEMEDHFLKFASALKVPPAILDTMIWRQMKEFSSRPRNTVPARPPQQQTLFSCDIMEGCIRPQYPLLSNERRVTFGNL